jgi:transcription elongation factor Elf1
VHGAQRHHGMQSRRRRSIEDRIDEVRDWLLTCEDCEHVGVVAVTLRQLRRANLICSECGVPIRRK